MKYVLRMLEPFKTKAKRLNTPIKKALEKQLRYLSNNPRHPSLNSHLIIWNR